MFYLSFRILFIILVLQSFQLTKDSSYLHNIDDDLHIPQNARPNEEVNPELVKYFSLGPDGKPVQNYLKPTNSVDLIEEWETKDYVELSTDKNLDVDNTFEQELFSF